MTTPSPLKSVPAYKAFTLACGFEGQEIAISGPTIPHLKKVFQKLYPKAKFKREMVVSAIIVPAKIAVLDKPRTSPENQDYED